MTDEAQTGPAMAAPPGTPQGDAAGHRADVAIQEVATQLAKTSRGRSVEEVRPQLESMLAERGITDQPDPWLDIVAREAAAGRVYVESNEALSEVTGLPVRDQDPIDAAGVAREVTGEDNAGFEPLSR